MCSKIGKSPMKKFETIDISGDVGIRAYGKTIEEVFVNAAFGMYSLITGIEGIEATQKVVVETKSDSLEGLLVSYLNELIFQFDAYGFVGKTIMITEITPTLSPSENPPEAETLPPRGVGMGDGEAVQLKNGEFYLLKAKLSGEEFDIERHERKLLIKAATYHKVRIEKVRDVWEIDVIFDI